MNTQSLREGGLILDDNFCLDQNVESWISLIESLITEHDYQKAEDCIRMALCISPHCENLWIKLGNLFLKLDQSDEAEKSFIEAVKINPTDKQAQEKLVYLSASQSR